MDSSTALLSWGVRVRSSDVDNETLQYEDEYWDLHGSHDSMERATLSSFEDRV